MPARLTPVRDLPWRHTRDPWAVLVSEVMLQQTQVQRVIPRWHEWMRRYPTPIACAAAPVADVLRTWDRLGYPRRALGLHRAARVIVADHHGRVPSCLEDLLALPGVGPYTARAVLAFAFEADVAVVDTNVARVLARVAGRRLTAAVAQRKADSLVPAGRGWSHNQAMLDLGATVCTSRSPRCGRCPFGKECGWRAGGHAEPDPAAPLRRQAPFAGSDRQGRGRLMAVLRERGVSADELAEVMGWPDDVARAERVAATLVGDGLVERAGRSYALEGGSSLNGPVIS